MLVTICMMILTACAPPAAPAAESGSSESAAEAQAEEKVTLRMTALGGIVAEAVTSLTDQYMTENPNVEIIVDVQGDDMSWQKTAPTTMFAVSDGPDFSWWWCGRFAQFHDMMDAGLLVSLDDLTGWMTTI
jgi:ABC-type glycerol-3-phosphate transport system substrate-binding protein